LLKDIENGKTIEIAPPFYKGKVAADYPLCLEIIERDVKPERKRLDPYRSGTNYKRNTFWWLYGADAKTLYRTIAPLEKVLVVNRHSKLLTFTLYKPGIVFSDATVVLAPPRNWESSIIVSSFHCEWSWKYSARMGDSTLRYSPSDCFENYPFPQNISREMESKLESTGEKYHEHRKQLMLNMQLGLTKTYNQFHNEKLCEIPPLASGGRKGIPTPSPSGRAGVGFSSYDNDVFSDNGDGVVVDPKKFEKKYGKQSYELWKHLERTEGTISYNEAVEGIFELRRLHMEMDELVLEAYGWSEEANGKWQIASEEVNGKKKMNSSHSPLATHNSPIALKHNFYDVGYLPENDRLASPSIPLQERKYSNASSSSTTRSSRKRPGKVSTKRKTLNHSMR
jgi:hypothetical protein